MEKLTVAQGEALNDAIAAWRDLLGAEGIWVDPKAIAPYGESTSLSSTSPSAVLFPKSTEEVVRIVKIASQHGIPLYPISRGRNWGYGDACAPTAGQVIVDLGRMNRIIEINPRLGYAVIEPGVTQGQFWKALQGTGLWMDATGAGPESSLVGNMADRGFGHTRYGDHFLSACGVEVVLADGRVLNTGYGHYANARARWTYKYGVGPVLDGLFSQSNLGIITRMGIWLMPEPEDFCAFFFSSPDDSSLERLIDRLAPLKMQGILQSAIHIANDLRALSGKFRYPWERARGATPLPDELRAELRREHGVGAWNGCGAITGTRETVAAVRRTLKRELKGYGPIFLNDRKLKLARRLIGAANRFGLARTTANRLEVVDPIYRMLKGEPVTEPLQGARWRLRPPKNPGEREPENLAESGAGLIWTSPILPMTGEDARKLMSILTPIYRKHGFEDLVTFTLLTERALCCVTNVSFDRRIPEEAERAGRCYQELTESMMREGFLPYRSGPLGMAKLAQGSSVFWGVVADLKRALDPSGTLSPGRYQPQPNAPTSGCSG